MDTASVVSDFERAPTVNASREHGELCGNLPVIDERAVRPNPPSLDRSSVFSTMRQTLVAAAAILALVACRASEPLRELSARDDRMRALDSLARERPCTSVRSVVLFDSTVWTPAHACAVASRALQLLGRTRAHEPYMAPGDTARVSVMRVIRERGCRFSSTSGVDSGGRLDSLTYVVEMEVPDRPHFLAAAMDARTFVGGAAFDAHPRGVWGSSPHLTPPVEVPDTLEAGAPCGQS